MPDAFTTRLEGAEMALLAAAVFTSDAATLLAAVEPEEFASLPVRAFWGRCRDLYRERGRLGTLELATDAWLDQLTLQVILSLQAATIDARQALEEFRCASALRRAVLVCEQAKDSLRGTAFNGREAVDALGGVGAAIQRLSSGIHIDEQEKDLSSAWRDYVADLREPGAAWRLSTGVLDLDERIGGLGPGTFTVAVGRSGEGKSSLALTAALLAARGGARVLVVSREMGRKELASRFAAAGLDEPLNQLRRKLTAGDPGLEDAAWEATRLPIVLEDNQAHIDAIRAQVQRERLAGAPFRLVVLDFLQILVADGREQHERLERIAYGAKDLAMAEGCAVIGLAQPNRVGSKAEGMPTMSDIRGSSAVENAADSVVALRRLDAPYPGAPYPFLLRVEKARNGRPGGLAGTYELGPGTFLVSQLVSEPAENGHLVEAIR